MAARNTGIGGENDTRRSHRAPGRRGRRSIVAVTTGLMAAALVAGAVLVAGCAAQESEKTSGVDIVSRVTSAIDKFTATDGTNFGSSAAMTEFLSSTAPRLHVVDANKKPGAAKRVDSQVAVLVSGGPLFAFGVYDTGATDGKGACRYASTYGVVVGTWAYGTGSPGVVCGGVHKGASELNQVVWSTDKPS